MSTVKTASELGKSVNNKENEIIIEGDLGKKVIRIKAKGPVAWAIAFGAIAVAVITVLTTPAAPPVAFIATTSAAGAVAILGLPATIAAISMAVAVKSKHVLTSLREDYEIIAKSNERVTLRRK